VQLFGSVEHRPAIGDSWEMSVTRLRPRSVSAIRHLMLAMVFGPIKDE
jgi:hypothetical protein